MNQSDLNQAIGFIHADIQREIDIARAGGDAGNFLCAVALLCYTEFGGGVMRGRFQRGESETNFNTFFDTMGVEYASFRREHDVYDIFRCGLAHEYYVKRSCQIAMLLGRERIGIGRHQNGTYFFVVERYFNDFWRVFNTLFIPNDQSNIPEI